MISLVVCSVDVDAFHRFEKNVSETIGLPFEIIAIRDAKETGGICQAYNRGAGLTRYDNICFCHEDVFFHSTGWGQLVLQQLADKSTGLIALAGAALKTKNPSPWWISNFGRVDEVLYSNVWQHLSGKRLPRPVEAEDLSARQIVVADGVWMCCRKEVWSAHPFDQTLLKGFHFYDLDFSLQLHVNGYRNFVVGGVLMEHFSAGKLNSEWVADAERFHDKWRGTLPVSLRSGDAGGQRLLKRAEHEALRGFLIVMQAVNYRNRLSRLGYLCKYFLRKPFTKESLSFFYHFIKPAA